MARRHSRYSKVEPATIERRAAPRLQVSIKRAAVKRRKSVVVSAELQDISLYGCKLVAGAVFADAENVAVQFADEHMMDAQIVWQKGAEAGCRFADKLCPKLLRRLTLGLPA